MLQTVKKYNKYCAEVLYFDGEVRFVLSLKEFRISLNDFVKCSS